MFSWYVAFSFGIVFFVIGILYLTTSKELKKGTFAKTTAFEFLTIWIMYLPDLYFNNVPDSAPMLKVTESILTSLLQSINSLLGNDAQRVVCTGHPIFSSVYMMLLMAAHIVLYLCVFGFLINFLERPAQKLSMLLRKKRNVYVFSVLNEKTISIAESIVASNPKLRNKNPKCIVFTRISKEHFESWNLLKQRAEAINAVRLESGLEETFIKMLKHAKKIEVFLFADNDNDNLSMLSVVSECAKVLKKAEIRAYVELSSMPWTLMDDYSERQKNESVSNLVVNFIRPENHFVYNNFLNTSVFENAILSKEGDVREIKFLLVGMNDRNLEMLKTLLHLCQMPGYKLTMMVIDKGENKEKIRQLMPEIVDECNKEGDAIYEIRYFENVDLDTLKFEEIVQNGFNDFTFAFINVGNDFVNLDLSIRLNSICYRDTRFNGYRIQMCASNVELDIFKGHKLLPNIEIVGEIKNVYNYQFITMSDIEIVAERIHNVRHKKEVEGEKYKTWQQYCNNEFNRQAVYARILNLKYKIQIIDEQNKDMDEDERYALICNDEMWKKYEHMRWSIYTRTLGYCLADKKICDKECKLDKKLRSVAKIHNLLIEYDELPEDEKKKDGIDIRDEVKVLKRI